MPTHEDSRAAIQQLHLADDRVLAGQHVVLLFVVDQYEHHAGYQTFTDHVQHLGYILGAWFAQYINLEGGTCFKRAENPLSFAKM